jgi:hypothetical protein
LGQFAEIAAGKVKAASIGAFENVTAMGTTFQLAGLNIGLWSDT